MQNTSHAVMSQRTEARDSLDDFPTPPWATRALFQHVINDCWHNYTCWEPACGAGHMGKVLANYFKAVINTDIHDYGYGLVRDFLKDHPVDITPDWIITNPPFILAEEFILKSLSIVKVGVAILARTVLLESIGRYEHIFRDNPPTEFAQFVEWVPMVKGRLDRYASTATGYAWFVWRKVNYGIPQLLWIPPCRAELERPTDYTDGKGGIELEF